MVDTAPPCAGEQAPSAPDFDPAKLNPLAPPAWLAELLAFTPVPLRTRRDGWTPERQRRYVAALAFTGSGRLAAASVGMSVQSACHLRRRAGSASFTGACGRAWAIGKGRRRAAAKVARAAVTFSPLGS